MKPGALKTLFLGLLFSFIVGGVWGQLFDNYLI